MSLTTMPVPGYGRTVPDPPGRPAVGLGTTVRQTFSGSPGRLRLIAIGAVLAVLFGAVVGAVALKARSDALSRASSSATHLLRLQGVQTNLAQADADSTNSFLQGGLESQAQRENYLSSMEAASKDLALAARHSQADAEALGEVNAALNRYSGFVASARANNRQGLSVGASYLTTASDLLEADVIKPLEERAAADQRAVDDAFADAATYRWILVLAVVVGIGGLVAAQVAVTRHSHRYVNLPAAASTLVLVIALAGAAVAMTTAQSQANDVRTDSLRPALDLSTSRVNAFQAKAQESLTLIEQGSATDEDPLWTPKFDAARDLATGEGAQELDAYAEQHEKINALDVDGAWRSAVRQATSAADDSANAHFTKYDEVTQKQLESAEAKTTQDLAGAGDALVPTAIVLLIIGLLCAGGAYWGVSFRIDEYR
ncbi:hypothetical protein [Kineosporia succinea]|uniref:Uncharacterized protein n=1 Tax=Kineosporia succinea TaxID=84632 RepID=A0ABT9P517_9ACTN|nr:hypothetical protein [Kineosporia succinea]MDP9827280.1 hypothetical protein [Kineosporia succinea]